MSVDDGGTAFPQTGFIDGRWAEDYGYGGMSLRDWFAGQAVASLLAHRELGALAPAEDAESVARQAYMVANAMIAQRKEAGR